MNKYLFLQSELYRLANKKLLKKLVLIEAQNKVVQENKLVVDNIE